MEPCTVRPYDGSDSYVLVCSSHEDDWFTYTVIEELAQTGCRIWYDCGALTSEQLEEELMNRVSSSACDAIVFVHTCAFGGNHECRQVLNQMGKCRKDVILIQADNTSLSTGERLQLRKCDVKQLDGCALSIDELAKAIKKTVSRKCIGNIDSSARVILRQNPALEKPEKKPMPVYAPVDYTITVSGVEDNLQKSTKEEIPEQHAVEKPLEVTPQKINVPEKSAPLENMDGGETKNAENKEVIISIPNGEEKTDPNKEIKPYDVTPEPKAEVKLQTIVPKRNIPETKTDIKQGLFSDDSKTVRVDVDSDDDKTVLMIDPDDDDEHTVLLMSTPKKTEPRPIIVRLLNGDVFEAKNEGYTVIGQAERTADVVIDNVHISRNHAKLLVMKGKYYIEDNGSANGTAINGETLEKNASTEVTEVNLVTLADEKFVILFGSKADAFRNGAVIGVLTSSDTMEARAMVDDGMIIGKDYQWATDCFQDQYISHKHAEITYEGGTFTIHDDSTNGTRIHHEDGLREILHKQSAILNPGDRLTFGTHDFEFTCFGFSNVKG